MTELLLHWRATTGSKMRGKRFGTYLIGGGGTYYLITSLTTLSISANQTV
jgi:hypothetical protein